MQTARAGEKLPDDVRQRAPVGSVADARKR
jgi:hypothetical protein